MTVSARTLWLTGFGAATAWSVDLLAVVASGSSRCLRTPLPLPRFGGTWWVLLAITVLAFLAGVWAIERSRRALHSAGDGPVAGRIRFMAFGGLILNAMFLTGLGFSLLALFLVPVCR